MGNFELASDYVINDTLKPHVDTNFRVVSAPGKALGCHPDTGEPIFPKILTTGSGNAIQEGILFEKLIEMAGKEKPNVVYIGVSERTNDAYHLEMFSDYLFVQHRLHSLIEKTSMRQEHKHSEGLAVVSNV